MTQLLELDKLKNSKNLLAFSAGIDSSALFHLLHHNSINFDIAIVNYNTRVESKEEVKYAQNLAKEYNKNIFLKEIKLNCNNFEAEARKIRYKFFEQIIAEHNYNNLITAHQLNDRVEWLLMSLAKGSSIYGLVGMQCFDSRDKYNIIRPLLNHSKDELLEYLNLNKITYFYDKSNNDLKYIRNKFRLNYANNLVKEYKNGLIKSFELLTNDFKDMVREVHIKKIENLTIFERSESDSYYIDKVIKKMGYIMSYKQRVELINKDSIVIHNIAVERDNRHIYIFPYIKDINMTKEYKEISRKLKVPHKLRKYLYKEKIPLETISSYFYDKLLD